MTLTSNIQIVKWLAQFTLPVLHGWWIKIQNFPYLISWHFSCQQINSAREVVYWSITTKAFPIIWYWRKIPPCQKIFVMGAKATARFSVTTELEKIWTFHIYHSIKNLPSGDTYVWKCTIYWQSVCTKMRAKMHITDRWPLNMFLLLQKYACGNACMWVWERMHVKTHIGKTWPDVPFVTVLKLWRTHVKKSIGCTCIKVYWFHSVNWQGGWLCFGALTIKKYGRVQVWE